MDGWNLCWFCHVKKVRSTKFWFSRGDYIRVSLKRHSDKPTFFMEFATNTFHLFYFITRFTHYTVLHYYFASCLWKLQPSHASNPQHGISCSPSEAGFNGKWKNVTMAKAKTMTNQWLCIIKCHWLICLYRLWLLLMQGFQRKDTKQT